MLGRRSANPTLGDKVFNQEIAHAGQATMTIQGTVNKSFILLLLVLLPACFTWYLYKEGLEGYQPLMYGGAIAGFILALITIFRKKSAMYTAPLYAIAEGLFLGGLSAIFEAMFPGIVIQAVGLTFGTFFALLAAYKSGLIKATENFKLGVFAATGGIALLYLVSFIMSFFGTEIAMIHSSTWLGIGFSLFVVVIAALNLVLDFDFIENGEAAGAPKYMEWYAAFGLMVTLIWLYIEFLRLLAKLASRD